MPELARPAAIYVLPDARLLWAGKRLSLAEEAIDAAITAGEIACAVRRGGGDVDVAAAVAAAALYPLLGGIPDRLPPIARDVIRQTICLNVGEREKLIADVAWKVAFARAAAGAGSAAGGEEARRELRRALEEAREDGEVIRALVEVAGDAFSVLRGEAARGATDDEAEGAE